MASLPGGATRERGNSCGLAQSSERGVACFIYRSLTEKSLLKGAPAPRCAVFLLCFLLKFVFV